MKKSLQKFRSGIALLVIAVILYSCSGSKNVVGNAAIINAVDRNTWTFTALQVRPIGAGNGPTNGLYTVDYTPGKLNVYLPYFGTAFGNADLLSNKSPLSFLSKDFTAEKNEMKNGKWSVVLKPLDQKEVQSLTFTIFNNGSSSLNVVLTNRSPISFTGNILPYKKQDPS